MLVAAVRPTSNITTTSTATGHGMNDLILMAVLLPAGAQGEPLARDDHEDGAQRR